MNSKVYFLIGFGTGLVTGAISSMMYFKNKYNKIAEQQINEAESYYQNIYQYSHLANSELADDNAEINPINSNSDRSDGVLSQEARDEIKAKLLRNHEITTNYAKVYEEKHPDLFKEADKMTDEETAVNEEPDIVEQVNNEHQAHKNDPPRIITEDEYSNLPPHIDTQTLYFYNDDETLVDDEDDVIEDPALLVGNTLSGTDFIDSGEPIIFVYNPGISTAYEIQRVDGAWFNE